jgi:CBS domain-containing protein
MSRDVQTLSPGDTVQDAAQAMAELDVDAMAVVADDVLQGLVTERDLVIRVLAEGLDARTTTVGQVMSLQVVSCSADAALDDVLRDMAERRIRHMPVLDADDRLIGMLTLPRATASPSEGPADTEGPA